MSARLRAIATETLRILDSGEYVAANGQQVRLAGDIASAVAGTRLYLPGDDLPGGNLPGDDQPEAGLADHSQLGLEVTTETTLTAARRLGDVACLVFASAKNAGGGFRTGAQAQEESLARSSALFACQSAVPEFYDYHRAHRDLRYSDRVIYSPAVPVFRDDRGELLPEPYPVAFLTAAAPNLGAIRANQPESLGSVPGVLRDRAARVLRVAVAHGHRRLVLGAWGCGVFGNEPRVVAGAFADVLPGARGLEQVVFAVHDSRRGSPAYTAFASVLGPAGRLR